MRVAFVLTSIPSARALESGAVHFEWLRGVAKKHSIELFLDQANSASDALRRSGVTTHVSVKRRVDYPDGETVSADGFQAKALSRSHSADPFDAVVYGGDMTVDLAWFAPELKTIPRGIALGAGLAQDLRAVWEDRRLFLSQVRRTWSATGLLSSADFILSDLPPAAFGLVDDGSLPPRYTTEAGQELSRVLETSQADPGLDLPRSVVVAATSVGVKGLEQLAARLVNEFPPAAGTTFIVLVRPRCSLGVSAKEALLEHCPEELQRHLVLVSTGEDGIAADFLAAADLILAVSPAELAVPAIGRAAMQKPIAILERDALEAGADGEPAGCFPGHRPVKRWNGEATRSLHVLTWEEPPARLAKALDNLSSDLAGDELVVIHAPDRVGPAADLFQLAGLGGVDLVIWGRPDGVFSHPEPNFIYPFALAIRGALVPTAARAIRSCDSIWQLICWASSGEWIDRSRLLLLPGADRFEFRPLEHIEHVTTTWSPNAGILPPPRWLPSGGQVVIPTPYPEPVAFPPWPSSPDPSTDPPALESWAQTSKWRERIRLALPWKLGLLDRAMRGRW